MNIISPRQFDSLIKVVDYNREHPINFVLEADVPEGLAIALMVVDPDKKYPNNRIFFEPDRAYWDILPKDTSVDLKRVAEHEEGEQLTDNYGQPVYDENDNAVLAEGGEPKYDEEGNEILNEYIMLLDVRKLYDDTNQEQNLFNIQLTLYNPELDRMLHTTQGTLLYFLPNGIKPPNVE